MLDDKISWKDVGIGAAATAIGVGAAIALKKPSKLSKLQKLSKGQLNWVTDAPSRFTTDRKNILDKAVGKLMYGDTKFYKVENAKDLKKLPRKLDGSTYYELGKSYDPKLYPKSDLSFNRRTELVDKVFQNKIEFAKLKSGGSIAKGDKLSKALRSPKDYPTFISRLSKQKDKYLKPSEEYASKGQSHISSKDLVTLGDSIKTKKRIDPKLSKKLKSAYKNQDNYVIQESIPMKKHHEQRVDFILHKGKATPIQKHRRWFSLEPNAPDFNYQNKVKKEIESIVAKNPRVKKLTKDDSYILGADVVKDKNKKLRIIEINDQSGFVDPTVAADKYVGHRLFKKVTGRETGVSRIGKGTVLGLGTYTAGDLAS